MSCFHPLKIQGPVVKKWHLFVLILGTASFNSTLLTMDSDTGKSDIPKPSSRRTSRSTRKADLREELRSVTAERDNLLARLASGAKARPSSHECSDIELGITSPSMRARSESDIASGIGEVGRSLSNSIDLQAHTLAGIQGAAAENARHRHRERKYNICTRRIAWGQTIVGAIVIVVTNWPKIASVFGGGHPGAPGNGTST